MAQIKVSSAKLTEEGDRIVKIKGQLENEITALRSDATRLTGMWEGEAKQAFVQSVQQNANLLTVFANNTQHFADALTQGASDYEGGENEAKKIASTKR